MKKFLSIVLMALVMTFASCGKTAESNERVATDSISEDVATCVVPQAATEVLPAAAPVPGLGKVATDVIPAE